MGLRKPKSVKHNGKTLAQILEAHERFWAHKEGGTRADLTGADLSETDLSGLDLAGAMLRGANLEGSDLRGARLPGADLSQARMKKADRIFCGHTHDAMQQEREGICYYNTGGWVDSKMTYITIDAGGVQIHEYGERSDDRDSGQERGETDSASAERAGESGLPEDAEYESIGS